MRVSLPILCLLLCACGGEPDKAAVVPAVRVAASMPPAPVAAPAPVAVTTSGERAVLDAYLAAINDHDADQAGAMLDENVHYFDAFSGQIRRDRKSAVHDVLAMYMNAVPDGHWEIRSEPAAGNGNIAYEWTFTGTNLGSWGGIGASGQKLNLKGISFVRIANGKIVYKADYFDTATLAKQMGWQ